MSDALPVSVPLDFLLVATVAGLAFGIVVGWVIGYVSRVRLAARLAMREAQLEARAEATVEREQALALATERLRSSFGELADREFRSHTENFLRLASENLAVHHERAKGELTARELAVEGLVRPIREALQRTDAQIHELENARREAQGSLKAQLDTMAAGQAALSQETRNLVNALRRPEIRGQWGELTLRRLVELAGMVEHSDFDVQSHRQTESGAIRPDLVIHLPEKRQLVVDVKTPLDAYLEGVQAETEAEHRAAMARHAGIVAGRVRDLAAKAYWQQFERSPEFVILFIPGDQFLSAALAHRPALLDDAMRQNVILATPSSFVALLKAVAYGWQQVKLAENAAEIRTLGTALYDRLNSFATHLQQVGKSLGDSVKAYNKGIGSLERMVLPSARKFTELGVKPRHELTKINEIDDLPRPSMIAETDESKGVAPTPDADSKPASAQTEPPASGIE